jgi:hypothetical protein
MELQRGVLMAAAMAFLLPAPLAARQVVAAPPQLSRDWGELLFDRTYRSELVIASQCDVEQRVTLTTVDLPDVVIPSRVTLAPRQRRYVPYSIAPSRASSAAGTIRGQIVAAYEGSADCPPTRVTYAVTARARAATPDDERREADAMSTALIAAACDVWRRTGQNPGPALANRKDIPRAAKRTLRALNEAACSAQQSQE